MKFFCLYSKSLNKRSKRNLLCASSGSRHSWTPSHIPSTRTDPQPISPPPSMAPLCALVANGSAWRRCCHDGKPWSSHLADTLRTAVAARRRHCYRSQGLHDLERDARQELTPCYILGRRRDNKTRTWVAGPGQVMWQAEEPASAFSMSASFSPPPASPPPHLRLGTQPWRTPSTRHGAPS